MYFTSDKSGDWQIWRYNFQEKSTVQITQKGGYQVKSDELDEVLYFTKYRQQGIWQLTLKNSQNKKAEEKQLIDNVSRSVNFNICPDSIYYATESDNIELWQMNFKTAKKQKILTYALNSNFKFDLRDDCQKLIFSKQENIESDILMLNL